MAYYFGLFFVIILIFFSFDDLLLDLTYYFYLLTGKVERNQTILESEIRKSPIRMMALIIAAYREEDVIEDVLRNFINTSQYPHSMLHIFVGVYPNDPATTGIIERLNTEFPFIHPVVHVLQGPSSKADNINNVLRNIFIFEKENHIRFNFVVIHDSEDVIHPFEFRLENHLMEREKAVQIPVFPIQEPPTIKNFFTTMVSGTYADEFAENHQRTMVIRNTMNAFVPSAGTGFAIRRDVLDLFPDGEVFPMGSLTEDYMLSMQLKRKGIRLYYPLEKVARVSHDNKIITEYIATRSMFPNSYKAAVKQKTRWIHGITMQSFKLREVFKFKDISKFSKYTFYKDWKSKISNLFALPGYFIFAYFIVSLFFDIPVMYRYQSLSWYLMMFLTAMMIHRLTLRYFSVKAIYGRKSAFFATYLPPLIPLRMVLGNLINFHATARAWRNHLIGIKQKQSKSKISWSKTDHEFMDEAYLERTRRTLGDMLLDRDLISARNLKFALFRAKQNKVRLRDILIRDYHIPEIDLMEAICSTERQQFLNRSLGNYMQGLDYGIFTREECLELQVLPFCVCGDMLILLAPITADRSKIATIVSHFSIEMVYTTKSQWNNYYYGEKEDLEVQNMIKDVQKLVQKDYISIRQAIMVMRFWKPEKGLKYTLDDMGLYQVD